MFSIEIAHPATRPAVPTRHIAFHEPAGRRSVSTDAVLS